jgi:hypothetical protein
VLCSKSKAHSHPAAPYPLLRSQQLLSPRRQFCLALCLAFVLALQQDALLLTFLALTLIPLALLMLQFGGARLQLGAEHGWRWLAMWVLFRSHGLEE